MLLLIITLSVTPQLIIIIGHTTTVDVIIQLNLIQYINKCDKNVNWLAATTN